MDGTCDCQPGFGSSGAPYRLVRAIAPRTVCVCLRVHVHVSRVTKVWIVPRKQRLAIARRDVVDTVSVIIPESVPAIPGLRVDSVPIVAAIPLVSTDRAETERVSVTRARVPRIKENDAKSRRVTRTATVWNM